MLPDDDALAREWDYVPVCLDCGSSLEDGQRYRCCDCTAAAYRAIERAGGKTVRLSDIDRERTDNCAWVSILLGKFAGQLRCYDCGAIKYDGQSFADVFATFDLYARGLIEDES